jgi:hypothetical protein
MLGDGGPCDRHAVGDLVDRQRPAEQSLEDPAPGGIPQRAQGIERRWQGSAIGRAGSGSGSVSHH